MSHITAEPIAARRAGSLITGEPGRALANGDILRLEAITRHAVIVRRLLDPDLHTGHRRFTNQAFQYPSYSTSDLAYAITGHAAQCATVHTGIALVTGSERAVAYSQGNGSMDGTLSSCRQAVRRKVSVATSRAASAPMRRAT